MGEEKRGEDRRGERREGYMRIREGLSHLSCPRSPKGVRGEGVRR